jgi:hypothetical protein
MDSHQWPASRDFVEAIQNPALCFSEPELKASTAALDRLGMPLVTSGQFAYVFKLDSANGAGSQAVRCFRGYLGDRQQRYQEIDARLDSVTIPALASFEYDPEGLTVQGRKYPIQVMEWVDGNALDVYLSKVLSRPDAIKYVAERWIEVISSLRKAGVAHGDLQHGNIIVQGDGLVRLVDLDGMFVPAMAGWKASELGHSHYQHPKRLATDFSENLDNFSALVVYVSLLAIAERPELWQEHHDENLILTKSDYGAPGSSEVFRKLGKLSKETHRLSQILEEACLGEPLDCPDLLTLVAPPSKLPSWMKAAPQVVVQTTTREAQPSSSPPPVLPQYQREVVVTGAQSASSATPPWWQPSTVTTVPGGSASPAPIPAFTPSLRRAVHPSPMREVAGHSLSYAFMGVFFIWLWFPALRALFQGLGADQASAGILAVVAFLTVCTFAGHRRAVNDATSKPVPPIPIPVATVPFRAQYRSYGSAPVGPPSALSPSRAAYIGHRVSRVYHEPNCDWARKTSVRNRVSLVSSADAKKHGFRPCRSCRPS